MVLTIAALDSVGMIDNWTLGRADLQLRLSSSVCCVLSTDCGCMSAHSGWADGNDGNGDDGNGDAGNGDDSDGDSVGDCKHSTRSTLTSRLATSTLASKLLQT